MMRKSFCLCLSIMAVLSAFAQTEIQLIVKGENIKQVHIYDLSQQEFQQFGYKDTLNAIFSKKHVDCYVIIYSDGNKNFQDQIYLDPGKVKVYGHVDSSSLVIDSVINAPTYYELREFFRKYAALSKAGDEGGVNDHLLNGVRRFSKSPLYIRVAHMYVDRYQNSPVRLLLLKYIVDSLPEKYSWFMMYPSGVERMEKILAGVKVQPGNYFFTDRKGDRTKISLQGNAHYVLDFWFLACKPCREDHLQIKDEYELLKKNNVEMISVSTDNDYREWVAYLKQHGFDWPNFLQDSETNISKDLSILTYPAYVILDDKGKVVGMYDSYEKVRKLLLVKK